MKNIYLIVGRSGSGKTTITEALESKYSLKSIQSYTTRPKRNENETGHIFVSDAEFDALTNMVAYTEFNKFRYCATTKQVETHDLYVIDPNGVKYFFDHYKGNKNAKVIYIDVSVLTCFDRMEKRGISNGKEPIMATVEALDRISNDNHEFYDYIHGIEMPDFIVLNNEITIDEAVDRIINYINKEESNV